MNLHYLGNLVILVRVSRAWDIFLKREWKKKEENSVRFYDLFSRVQDFINRVLYWLKIAHARVRFVRSLVSEVVG